MKFIFLKYFELRAIYNDLYNYIYEFDSLCLYTVSMDTAPEKFIFLKINTFKIKSLLKIYSRNIIYSFVMIEWLTTKKNRY